MVVYWPRSHSLVGSWDTTLWSCFNKSSGREVQPLAALYFGLGRVSMMSPKGLWCILGHIKKTAISQGDFAEC